MEEEPWTEVGLTGVLAESHSVLDVLRTRADGRSWAVLMQEIEMFLKICLPHMTKDKLVCYKNLENASQLKEKF